MSRNFVRSGFVAAALLLSVSLAAQDLMVYPAKGQSQDQQEQDQAERHLCSCTVSNFSEDRVIHCGYPVF